MARTWEISYKGAEELDKLAKKLEDTRGNFMMANKKIENIISQNSALGPHKNEIQSFIDEIVLISKKCSDDTDCLSDKIREISSKIRTIVDNSKIGMGK